MNYKIINNSTANLYHIEQVVDHFFPYSQKRLKFDKPVTISFESDVENAQKMLGKTAYYDPEGYSLALYVDDRHPKDILRSLSHELVHHAQNCRGEFAKSGDMGPGYAQKDPHMRDMELEAYTEGNIIFRDFEDLIKVGKINIKIDFDEGEKQMSLKEWKNNEINSLLLEKWGIGKKEAETTTENEELEKAEVEESAQGVEHALDTPAADNAQALVAKQLQGLSDEDKAAAILDILQNHGVSADDLVNSLARLRRASAEVEPAAAPAEPAQGGRPTPRRHRGRGPEVRGLRFEESNINELVDKIVEKLQNTEEK